MLQIFFQTTFWILALWIIYFKFCNFSFRTIFLQLSIIFFVILRIVLQDKLFVNCCFGQYICKLLWWIFCFQIFILDNFSGKLSFWTTFWRIVILDNFFLQIIDLNNFLLQMVIVNCFFFYKLSFQLYLFEKCPSGQSFCNLLLWINHLANCPF